MKISVAVSVPNEVPSRVISNVPKVGVTVERNRLALYALSVITEAAAGVNSQSVKVPQGRFIS